MLKTFVRLTPNFSVPLLFHNRNEFDNVIKNKRETSESGWGRVKDMYSISEHGETSKELAMVLQGSFTGGLLGACIGASLTIKPTYHQFVEKNQKLIYKSMRDAQNQLRNTGFKALAQGAFYWGWRTWLLSGAFILVANTVAVYTDQTPVTEYAIAGAMAGGFFRAKAHPSAMFKAAVLGGILSILGALIVIELLTLSTSTEDTKATDNTLNLRQD